MNIDTIVGVLALIVAILFAFGVFYASAFRS